MLDNNVYFIYKKKRTYIETCIEIKDMIYGASDAN